jgi:RimJ/RimL family protein N-acetyltransferase
MLALMADSGMRAPTIPPPTREVVLRDGTPLLMRPIRPDDKDRLREGFARLSQTSRYRRFMTALNRLSDAQVRYLTEIDYVDHMAWVAIDPTQPTQPGLGVARYVRLPSDPATAEAAVTVIDEQQGKGIGTILLGLLAASAHQHGITRFRAYVLAENTPMIEILHDLGATVTDTGPLLQVDVPIPAGPEELPDTPTGRVFKAVAAQALPPFQLHHPGTRYPGTRDRGNRSTPPRPRPAV